MASVTAARGGALVAGTFDPGNPVFSSPNHRRKYSIRETRQTISRLSFQYNPSALPSFSVRRSLHGNLAFTRDSPSKLWTRSQQSSLRFPTPAQPPSRPRPPLRLQARKSTSSGPSFPTLNERPEWHWRLLAAAPYLIALQISDAGFYVYPFLDRHRALRELIFYIPGAVTRWSVWFPMVYCYVAYLLGVKNRKWPHLFRYHLATAMLLENVLQIVWVTSNFVPLIHFNGTFGTYYWAAVAALFILVILEGVRCALGGKYVKIPFVSEAALIHSLYSVGGFQRPF